MSANRKDHVQIKRYGCIKQVDLRLSSLHALIGPNDSGKSTILRALQAAFPLAEGAQQTGSWIAVGDSKTPEEQRLARRYERIPLEKGSCKVLRLDPDVLRGPAPLIPSTHQILWFDNERGGGLPGLYDALLGRDRQVFIDLEDQFKKLFPTVKALRLENTTNSTKMLGLTLHDGTIVGPAHMSEGMLYWLAFAIVEHLSPVELLLIEEPENGLHPSRIREVMRILRKISEKTQVVLATHSPLVINELQPEEVTIVTRTPERGTICTPMKQTKNFEERSKVYALGELWLSYADGDFEEELVGSGTEASRE